MRALEASICVLKQIEAILIESLCLRLNNYVKEMNSFDPF